MNNFSSDQKLAILRGLLILSGLLGTTYQSIGMLNQFASQTFILGDESVTFDESDIEILSVLAEELGLGFADIVSAMKAGNADGITAIANSTNNRIKDLLQQLLGKGKE